MQRAALSLKLSTVERSINISYKQYALFRYKLELL
jgi:hypothetical protein